ncbi:nucleotidyltransferase [Haloimpatiens sp. FM7330]|uniref:nucleotidyltransferase n=1 Tax=Haloimpatiens sp. FM7330 TaxID=3298610 RepID=UPI0036458A83
MKISGIIVEYNPFHNGHIYHINKTKELTNCDGLIAVMSGNFVQRGIPAIIDKWLRTKIALMNGVDLVLELPCVYSLSSAEFFGFGAISLLNSLGIVDSICFGSENNNIETLMTISKIFSNEPEDFKISLKNYLNKGLSYPLARSKSLQEYLNKTYASLRQEELDDILTSSNNILGIEYCKSILKLSSNIKPFCIKREGNSYNDLNLNSSFSSASAIRNYLKSNNNFDVLKNFMPKNSYDIFCKLNELNYHFTFEEDEFKYIKYKALTTNNTLNKLPDISEGLDNKILKELINSVSLNDLILKIKSKRYTYTRINRILTHFFVGFDNYDIATLRKSPCPYAKILGFNSTGRKILKYMKSNSNIPVYTKIPKFKNDILNLDIQSTKAYSIINKNIHPNSDYLTSPIIHT